MTAPSVRVRLTPRGIGQFSSGEPVELELTADGVRLHGAETPCRGVTLPVSKPLTLGEAFHVGFLDVEVVS